MIDESLVRVVSDHFGVPTTLVASPTTISGGFWAAIYGFELSAPANALPSGWAGPLVLRVMPDRHRAEHEIVVQRTVADSGFATPRVLHSGFDEGLGGAFMVMPRAAGTSPLAGLSFGAMVHLPRILRRLPGQLTTVAINLHALDPVPLERALEAAGLGDRTDAITGRLTMVRSAVPTNAIGFDRLLTWFDDHYPHNPRRVICHGDLHPFNLLVAADGSTTLLDWTNGDIMPPEFDIGFAAGLLRCAPIRVPKLVRPVVARLTAALSRRFVAQYEAMMPLDASMLIWFEALQYARCLAEVATARSGLSHIVGENHPFEISAEAMRRSLAELTGISVTLPTRRPSPAS